MRVEWAWVLTGELCQVSRTYRNPYDLFDREDEMSSEGGMSRKDPVREQKERESFSALLATLRRLRGKDGCPWDQEQTISSMTPYIIEEAFEVVDAAGDEDTEKLKIEIGDLLFLLLFLSDIAEDEGAFHLVSVLSECNEKMIRRHPHVFGDRRAEEVSEASRNWEHVKQSVEKSTFGAIPLKTLPALVSAYRIQERAAGFGFDWDEPQAIQEKIQEELHEVSECLQQQAKNRKRIEEELGDLLFSVVNLCRFLKIDPERLLRQTVKKFSRRLQYINRKLAESGKQPESATLDEMEALWQQSKGEHLGE